MQKNNVLQGYATVAPKKLALVVLTLAATSLSTQASAINTVGGTGETIGVESISIREIGSMNNYGLE